MTEAEAQRSGNTARDARVMLITGGSRGIGAATARLAARHGYAVAVNYLRDVDAAHRVVEQCRTYGVRSIAVQADTADEPAVTGMFDMAIAELGGLDALVNNAGVTGPLTSLADLAAPELKRVLDVNVFGAMLCAREAVRRMATERGGRGGGIVNVSSGAATLGSPHEYVHYAASKAAIDTLTIGLSKETAASGIRVNAVSPGLIDTDIHAAMGMPDRCERMAGAIPMQRAGTAEEVAEAIIWLLSASAAYVTGANLRVAGGR